MAWPLTPLTTYTANFAPAIKAFDLNAFQSGINGIVGGTYSVAGVYVDGTGGAVVAAPAGSLTLTGGTASGTPTPTTAVPAGQVYRDAVCLGWARGYWNGANMILVRGFNVLSMARNGVGDYTIVFNPVVSDANSAFAAVTLGTNPAVVSRGFIGNPYAVESDGANRIRVKFNTCDPVANALIDTNATSQFFVEVKGY